MYLDRCCLWYWELFLDYIEYSLLNVPPHGEGAGGADKYIAASDGRPLGLLVSDCELRSDRITRIGYLRRTNPISEKPTR